MEKDEEGGREVRGGKARGVLPYVWRSKRKGRDFKARIAKLANNYSGTSLVCIVCYISEQWPADANTSILFSSDVLHSTHKKTYLQVIYWIALPESNCTRTKENV